MIESAGPPLEADLEHVLAHTDDVWPSLRGSRLLITGGTGFVGSWLLESLRHANLRLGSRIDAMVLTRDPEGFCRRAPHLAGAEGVTLWRGDVRTFEPPKHEFSHLIQGAASADAELNARDPLEMLDTIVQGTQRALSCAVAANIPTVLLISSGAVYGAQPPGLERVPEEFTGAPDVTDSRQAYAEGKRVAELMGSIHRRNGSFDLKIARLFAFVGPYLPFDRHFAIGNFIRDRMKGGPIRISGDGTPLRSYLYAADLAIWLWTILVRGASLRPYNVGSERALPIAEVARIVAEATPPAVPVHRAQLPRPGLPPERYVPDTRRARSELGLVEGIGLEDGIRRTINWARDR